MIVMSSAAVKQHEKATRRSAAHASQRMRAKPWARNAAAEVDAEVVLDPLRDGFAIGIGRCGVGEEGFEVVLDERVEGCGGGVAPAVDGGEAFGPRSCGRLREGAAGRGPAGAGRRARRHADDGSAR
jgi:hypothetical protein